ncbi:sucrase ferredoxin [Egbenema bharatensis]|uniref:sucrase ferredoxin n=1 Tax=Egbenema bharatensis TaxID=3463334 RepID=UPI003A86DB1F
MDNFFCAEQSRQSGVDIIGSAAEHQIYVAIECPPPWTTDDMESKGIPDNLRQLSEAIYDDYDRFQTRFLLIYNEHLKQENCTRVLFFRKPSGFANAYEKQEFHLTNIQDVAPLVQQYVRGEPIDLHPIDHPTRDILICTHGSRDRCCARFGNPIYHQALKIVEEYSLEQVRMWQASHIGGHRMAPTAIDFPEARYYGYLDPVSLTAVLTRTGDIQCLDKIYRGWGVLPWAAQVLEKQLLLTCGWDWFSHSVTAQVLDCDADETFNRVELTDKSPTGECQTYHADVVADDRCTVHLKGSCTSEKLSAITPYRVKDLSKS